MQCIEMGIRSSSHTTRHQWSPTPLRIYLPNLFPDGTELRNLRPRTSFFDLSPSRMASLHSRIKPRDNRLFGSQEPHLFPERTKVESQTSTMLTFVIRIRHKIDSHPWRKNDFIRRPIPTTRFYP